MLNDLFGYRILDSVIECAVAISSDYYARPSPYAGVDDEVANLLQDFRARTGTDPQWPDFAQRRAMHAALLGDHSGPSAFGAARDAVFGAATNYAEGAILHGNADSKPIRSAGEPALRQAFVDAMDTFGAVLSVVDGTAAEKSATSQVGAAFASAVKVLQSDKVAAAFGVEPAPGGSWPLCEPSGKGALLVETVSQRLAGAQLRPIRLQRFLVLQRLAEYGAATIGHATGGRIAKSKLERAIQDAYSWASAFSQLGAGTPSEG